MPPDEPTDIVPPENVDTAKPVDTHVEEVEQSADPKDLGGHLNEGGRFEADFDDIIDAVAKGKIPEEPEDGEPAKKKEVAPVKTAEEIAAEEDAAKKAAAAPADETLKADQPRDADLKDLEAKLDPHASPRTKEHFKAQAAKITEARDRADAAAKEAAEAKTALEEARKGGLPKEVTEELATLRDTVRELDATRDPVLVQKYDKKISSNDDVIIKVLRENGLGLDKDGKEIPGVLDALKKAGLSRKTLDDKITALEKAGEHEAAEEIKYLLRENSRLAKDKDREIGELKSTYDQRQTQAQEAQTKEVEAANKRMTDTFMKEVAKFDFLKVPPEVKPEDSPAVRKEKEKAIAAANDRVLKFADAVKKETGSPVDAQIAARTGILYRDHVVPTLQGQITARDATIASLQAQIKALKGAGDLSTKTGSSAPKPAAKEDVNPDATFDDAIDQMAKAAGVSRK